MLFHTSHITIFILFIVTLFTLIKTRFLFKYLNPIAIILAYFLIVGLLYNLIMLGMLETNDLSENTFVNIFPANKGYLPFKHISLEILGFSLIASGFLWFVIIVDELTGNGGYYFTDINSTREKLTPAFKLFLAKTFASSLILAIVILIQTLISSVVNIAISPLESNLSKPLWHFFDWLIVDNISTLNFHRGFNFAFVVSSIIGLTVLIDFIRTTKQVGVPVFLRYLILSIILGLGLFVTIYSLSNTVYNIRSFSSFSNWFKTESESGLLTIRLSSFVILFGLIGYTIKHIYNKRLVISSLFKFDFKKYDVHKTGIGSLADNKYSSIYFSQMGFYVLVFSILLYAYRIENHSSLTRIINLGLFFILDDWAIIYYYSSRTQKIGSTHRWRIVGLNILLFVLSAILLYNISSLFLLILYIICAMALFFLNRSNLSQVSTYS